jgi:ArsR family transcriptional regulator, arsenate/arsenite/antimonite-responsive transcriptional repressor
MVIYIIQAYLCLEEILLKNNEYVLIFKALADETRLSIVKLLICGELCGCKILENFNITQPTLSYHMKALCDSGLVEGRRDGAWMRYTLNREVFESVRGLFDGFCLDDTIEESDCECDCAK